jgi:hypothetical protein
MIQNPQNILVRIWIKFSSSHPGKIKRVNIIQKSPKYSRKDFLEILKISHQKNKEGTISFKNLFKKTDTYRSLSLNPIQLLFLVA